MIIVLSSRAEWQAHCPGSGQSDRITVLSGEAV